MLKVVGICILLFTIFYISRTMCEKERTKMHLMCEMSRFIHELRRALTVSMEPMPRVCRSFETDEPYFKLLLVNDFESLRDLAWASGLKQRVGNDAAEVFSNFVLSFGRGYLAEEIAGCDVTIREFDAILSSEKEGIQRKVRLFKTLGVASSFALVILFI